MSKIWITLSEFKQMLRESIDADAEQACESCTMTIEQCTCEDPTQEG